MNRQELYSLASQIYTKFIMGDFNNEASLSANTTIEVDVLIIGAGPSGASLGCFLGSHGMFASESSSFFFWASADPDVMRQAFKG